MNADKKLLYKHVEFLTTSRPFRNFANPESLERVALYISREFKTYGMEPYRQGVNVEGETSSDSQTERLSEKENGKPTEYCNVIAHYRPEKEKRLIVGAHYDVCDDQPGADDNASGVAGLLELARIVNHQCPDLPYGIDFVAYTLEEPPHYGSEMMGSFVHAKSVSENRRNIVGVINLEMIGYYSDEPSPGLPFPDSNFILVGGKHEYTDFNRRVLEGMAPEVGSRTMGEGIRVAHTPELSIVMADDPQFEPLIGLSDHRNYWEYDIPALMINDTSHLRNPNYHQPTDTIDTLNFDKMTMVVSAVYRAMTSLSPTKRVV